MTVIGMEAVILEAPVGTIGKVVAVTEWNLGMNLGVIAGELDNDITMTAEDIHMTEIDMDKNIIVEDMEEGEPEMNLLPCEHLVHTI